MNGLRYWSIDWDEYPFKSADHDNILTTLDEAGSEGLSLFALARKTGIRPQSLRKFFHLHRKSFCFEGFGWRYRISQRAPHVGSKKRIRAELMEAIATMENNRRFSYWIIGFTLLISFYSLLLAVLN